MGSKVIKCGVKLYLTTLPPSWGEGGKGTVLPKDVLLAGKRLAVLLKRWADAL